MFRKRRYRTPRRRHGRAGPAAGARGAPGAALKGGRASPACGVPPWGAGARRPRTRVPGSTRRNRGCHRRCVAPSLHPERAALPPPQPSPSQGTPLDCRATLGLRALKGQPRYLLSSRPPRRGGFGQPPPAPPLASPARPPAAAHKRTSAQQQRPIPPPARAMPLLPRASSGSRRDFKKFPRSGQVSPLPPPPPAPAPAAATHAGGGPAGDGCCPRRSLGRVPGAAASFLPRCGFGDPKGWLRCGNHSWPKSGAAE